MIQQKILPVLVILLQIISFLWYLYPTNTKNTVHVPVAFIEFILFGVFNLIVIGLYLILFLFQKQKTLLQKIPFILFGLSIILALYNMQ
ncbi:hypothetical protein [Aquimarina aquimarini]|uniref:hypothetical protein n=1 Tax=Aquimarina aquimarini TaxID=1191734 RepID=UPI000D55D25B|nr:hypothetical protein [Aquimarina aquimarini]